MQNSKERFSDRVADYVKYRPAYPHDIVDFLQSKYGLSKDKQIADVGAGTGISAQLFLNEGYNVIAVEPNKEMREKAIELLGGFTGFSTVDGAAENTNLPPESVDVIVCGQAFHWFDVEKTKEEFKRILKPGGIVVLIWNERKTESAFEKEYDELIIKHARDYVKVNHRNIDYQNIAAFFDPIPCYLEIFINKQVFDYAGLEGRLLSSSYMPQRADDGYGAMVADLKMLYDKYQENDRITIYYNTKVYIGALK